MPSARQSGHGGRRVSHMVGSAPLVCPWISLSNGPIWRNPMSRWLPSGGSALNLSNLRADIEAHYLGGFKGSTTSSAVKVTGPLKRLVWRIPPGLNRALAVKITQTLHGLDRAETCIPADAAEVLQSLISHDFGEAFCPDFHGNWRPDCTAFVQFFLNSAHSAIGRSITATVCLEEKNVKWKYYMGCILRLADVSNFCWFFY